MANSYFQFKQFTVHQDRCAMKVTTDGCLFGAWITEQVRSMKSDVRGGPDDQLLDIGTGTGLLSLMVAQKTTALIDAIEIDNDAFEQAKENAANSPWSERINVIHANVKEFPFSKQYDVIFSNPPFYENELKSGNSKKNRAHHDESLLLDELLCIIKNNLQPGGRFFLVLPYKRNEEIDTAVKNNNLRVCHKVLVRQSVNHNYFRIMIRGEHQQEKSDRYITTQLAIKNEKQEYTPEFIGLLKDYHLYL